MIKSLQKLCLKLTSFVFIFQIKLGSKAEAKDGINRTALREIKLLQELSHKNIITLCGEFEQEPFKPFTAKAES